MSGVSLEASGLSKSFASRQVISNLNFTAAGGEVLGILGSNGSGKSTVLRMIAGVLRPDVGEIALRIAGEQITRPQHPLHAGLVAPYLQVYDEFNPLELMSIHASMRGVVSNQNSDEEVLHRVGLHDRRDDVIRSFSSGLRQRAILALAVHLQPTMLLLDEPSVTMDDAGRRIIEREVALHRDRGGVVILATNDSREHSLCTRTISLP